jgi:hypothetical protein
VSEQKLYTISEASRLTGLTYSAIERRIANGEIASTGQWGGTPKRYRRYIAYEDLVNVCDNPVQGTEIISDVTTEDLNLNDTENLLRERGFNPDDWEVAGAKINEWEGPSEGGQTTYHQLKVSIVKKKLDMLIMPARSEGNYIRPRSSKQVDTDYRFVVLTGDQQAPFQDENLHELFCQWLRLNKPNEGVLLGDTMDFPEISRHRHKPEFAAATQECIDSGYQILRDYVASSEDTQWTKLPGNHDERIRNTFIDYMLDLHNLRQAGDDQPLMSIPNLLRLDELGIDYIEPHGPYQFAQHNLSNKLSARHGWLVTKGAGASAHKTLEHLGYSVVVGHTHRQGHVHQTKFDIHGKPETLAGVESGCMCDISKGLGYAPNPDWQNGFATAIVYPDGTFKLDLAIYTNENLYYRDQRFN